MIELLIVVPAHNEEENIMRCIDSINKIDIPEGISAKYTVVLDRCTDNTKRVLDKNFQHYIEKNWRGSFVNPIGECVEMAMKELPSDWVLKVDADIVVPKDALRVLESFMLSGYAAASARVVCRSKRLWIDLFYKIRDVTTILLPAKKMFGACILFKSEAVKEIGGFDENSPRWDTGFEMKLKKHEYITAVTKLVVVEERDVSAKKILLRQFSDGMARRIMKVGFWRTLGHSIIRGRLLVIVGYIWKSIK